MRLQRDECLLSMQAPGANSWDVQRPCTSRAGHRSCYLLLAVSIPPGRR